MNTQQDLHLRNADTVIHCTECKDKPPVKSDQFYLYHPISQICLNGLHPWTLCMFLEKKNPPKKPFNGQSNSGGIPPPGQTDGHVSKVDQYSKIAVSSFHTTKRRGLLSWRRKIEIHSMWNKALTASGEREVPGCRWSSKP